MKETLSKNAALILIDIQDGFDDPYWGNRNNKDAEQNAAELLKIWRRMAMPVFHIQHLSTEENSPLRPDRAGSAIKEIVRPSAGEPVLSKNVNSAFIGTDLEQLLKEAGIKEIVLAGLTTDHCVSTSTRMGANLGFNCDLVSDAVATFDRLAPDGRQWTADEVHSCHLASLNGEFATVLTSSELKGMLFQAAG